MINLKYINMVVRKTKDQNFSVSIPLSEAKRKCMMALEKGNFSSITNNELLGNFSAKYKSATVIGNINVNISEKENTVNIHVQATANTDNIFALFSSPNDKILNSFTQNFQ